MVLPLVAHHGPDGWKLSTEFIDLFGMFAPEALRPYLVSFRHILVDLKQIDDRALSTDSRLRGYLSVMKIRAASGPTGAPRNHSDTGANGSGSADNSSLY